MNAFPAKLLILTLVFSSTLSFTAEAKQVQFGLPAKDMPQEFQQKGDLFSIRIVPGSKETRLYIVGNEVAELKINQLDVVGKLKFGKNERVIRFERKGDYFSAPQLLTGDMQLNVKMTDEPKEEIFQLRLKKD